MNKLIVISIIVFIIGLFIGFNLGSYVTIKAVASVAGGFVDEEMIQKAIYQYNNHIGNCFPSQLDNASIYDDTGD